jgi:hypothetical protein
MIIIYAVQQRISLYFHRLETEGDSVKMGE